MAEPTTDPAPTPKRRRWLRLLGWVFGVGLLLLVVVYFVATSSMFLTGVILPQVGKSLHATVTVESASISPFSSVELRGLKVQAAGAEPLLTVQEVRARYSLLSIMGGNIKVSEVALVAPTINVVEQADGSKNIDALMGAPGAPPKPAQSSGNSKPLRINIEKIAITDALFRTVKNYPYGARDVTEVSNLDLEISNIQNGQTGKLVLSADVKVDKNPPAPGTNGLLRARLTSDLVFALTDDLGPASFKGSTRLDTSEAAGDLGNFSKLVIGLDTEATADDIKQIALHFDRNGATLGEVRISGPFNLLKSEGQLDVDVRSIDREILNLVGASSGMDFGGTSINSTNHIVLTKSGTVIRATGGVNLAKFQVTRAGVGTPVVDAAVQYSFQMDSGQGNARFDQFTINATQNGRRLLAAEIVAPMAFAWGQKIVPGMGDSAWMLALTNLNLGDWKPVVGDACPMGVVNATMKLASGHEGKSLGFGIGAGISGLTLPAASNRVMEVGLTVQARAEEYSEFTLDNCQLQVSHQGQPFTTLNASGKYSKIDQSADLQVRLQAMVTRLVEAMQLPGMTASSGTVELRAQVTQKQDAQSVTGALLLADLSGNFSGTELHGFGFNADFDVARDSKLLEIRKLAGGLLQHGKSGGHFEVTGKYAPETKAAELMVNLDDFNQDGLRPVIEPQLGGKKLTSLSVNGTSSIQSVRPGEAAINVGLQLSKLVVTDAQNQSSPPLAAKVLVEGTVRKYVANLTKLSLALSPTARAKNELLLTGKVDLSHSDAITGDLKLAADSLDFTPYYDLMAGNSKSNSAPAPVAAQPASAASNEELPAKELPLRNFAVNVDIGGLYLREIEVTKLQTLVKIDGGHVVVDPFQLALNGAPVSAKVDLDMGVPGYKYDVSFNAQKIPQAPLVNSLQPDRKGQISGTCTLDAAVKGAGTTGANLKKNLTGSFNVVSTNLDLAIPNVKSPIIFGIINTIIALPELINGTFGGKKGWLDDFMSKPIDLVEVRGSMGGGDVNLKKATVQGLNFKAEAPGKIVLAEVLTNSTLSIPIDVYLGYHSAEGLGLVSGDTSTNTAYVKLPQFLTMKGTVGAPIEDVNKLALAKLAGKTLGGLGMNIGKAVGTESTPVGKAVGNVVGKEGATILKSVKSLFGSKKDKSADTNAPSATK